MKSKHLFVIAAALLILGFVTLFHDFHGTVSFTGSIPAGSSGLEISGSTHGAIAIAGMLTVILAVFTFIIAVVRAYAYETGK